MASRVAGRGPRGAVSRGLRGRQDKGPGGPGWGWTFPQKGSEAELCRRWEGPESRTAASAQMAGQRAW